MKFANTLRSSRATAIVNAAGSGAKIKFYNGTESLTPAGTLLATLTITGAFGTVTNGVIDINETVTQTNANHVSGTPTFALITTSADVPVATLAISADMTFTGTITTGVDVTLNAPCTLTEGNA